MSFANDLTDAVVLAIQNAGSDFGAALGASPNGYRVEASFGSDVTLGRDESLVQVVPVGVTSAGGDEFADSQLDSYDYELRCILSAQNRDRPYVNEIYSAMSGVFNDGGAAVFAQLTDTGSNRLGASGRVTMNSAQLTLEESGHPTVLVSVTITVWHTV